VSPSSGHIDPFVAECAAERKALILGRIERQRLVRKARRLQREIDALRSEQGLSSNESAPGTFPKSMWLREMGRSPLILAGLLGLLALTGPSKLSRLADSLLPVLLRKL
jgi:hypothetical protein